MTIQTNQSTPCLICTPRRTKHDQPPRHPNRGLVCDACRAHQHATLAEIRAHYTNLANQHDPTPDQRRWQRPNHTNGKPDGTTTETWAEPINATIPAGPVPPIRTDANVSGSHEAPAPTNLDHLDLTAHIRNTNLTPAGRANPDDQIGHLSAVATLDFWATDWIVHRAKSEQRPNPTVNDLTHWLETRLDEACDNHPAIDEYANDLGRLRTTLRAAIGDVDVPDYKRGIPCRNCGERRLYRLNGAEWIECSGCPELLSPDEYNRWTGLLAAQVKQPGGVSQQNRLQAAQPAV